MNYKDYKCRAEGDEVHTLISEINERQAAISFVRILNRNNDLVNDNDGINVEIEENGTIFKFNVSVEAEIVYHVEENKQ